jgi:membrane fusion protein, multidrug efflux system
MTGGLGVAKDVAKDHEISGRRRNRVALIMGAIIAGFALYELITSFVAYTDDAFVRSYLVAIAPEVTGRIINVTITDNQLVKAGDPLIEIDPVPFQLIVNQRQAQIDEVKAQLLVDQDNIAKAGDSMKAATSALALARVTQQRAASLRSVGDVSQATTDKANDALNRALADLASAQSAAAATKATAAMHEASLERAKAEMATAQ